MVNKVRLNRNSLWLADRGFHHLRLESTLSICLERMTENSDGNSKSIVLNELLSEHWLSEHLKSNDINHLESYSEIKLEVLSEGSFNLTFAGRDLRIYRLIINFDQLLNINFIDIFYDESQLTKAEITDLLTYCECAYKN